MENLVKVNEKGVKVGGKLKAAKVMKKLQSYGKVVEVNGKGAKANGNVVE